MADPKPWVPEDPLDKWLWEKRGSGWSDDRSISELIKFVKPDVVEEMLQKPHPFGSLKKQDVTLGEFGNNVLRNLTDLAFVSPTTYENEQHEIYRERMRRLGETSGEQQAREKFEDSFTFGDKMLHFGQALVEPYTSLDSFYRTLRKEPLRVPLDLTILGAGYGLLRRGTRGLQTAMRKKPWLDPETPRGTTRFDLSMPVEDMNRYRIMLDRDVPKISKYIDFDRKWTNYGRFVNPYKRGTYDIPERAVPVYERNLTTKPFKPGGHTLEKPVGRFRTKLQDRGRRIKESALSPHNIDQELGLDVHEFAEVRSQRVMNTQRFMEDLRRLLYPGNRISRARQATRDRMDIDRTLGGIAIKNEEVLYKFSEALDLLQVDKRLLGEKPTGQQLASLKHQLKQASSAIKNLSPQRIQLRKDMQRGQLELAKRNPDVRTYMLAEKSSHPKWMQKELSKIEDRWEFYAGPEQAARERLFVTKLQEYMQTIKGRLEFHGMKHIQKDYMPHIFQDTVNRKLMQGGGPTLGQMIKLYSRKGGPSILPSSWEVMRSYPNFIEGKLLKHRLHAKYGKTVDPDRSPFAHRLLNDMLEYKSTAMDRFTNAVMGAEYARDIALSVGVAMKHALKMPLTVGRTGIKGTAQGVQAMLKALVPGEEGRAVRHILGNMMSSKALVRSIDSIPSMSKGIGTMFKKITANPTLGVEAFETGVDLLGNIAKHYVPGVDVAKFHKGLTLARLDANFAIGTNAPGFYRNPAGRLVSMYQMTPYKMAESVIKTAFKGVTKKGKDGKTRLNLRGDRDLMGNSYQKSLIRAITMWGAAEMYARAHDSTVMDVLPLIHFPFGVRSLDYKYGRAVPFKANVPILDTANELASVVSDTSYKSFFDVVAPRVIRDAFIIGRDRGWPPQYDKSATRLLLRRPKLSKQRRWHERNRRLLLKQQKRQDKRSPFGE